MLDPKQVDDSLRKFKQYVDSGAAVRRAVTLRNSHICFSHDMLIEWFWEVDSPTKSSTYCFNLRIETTS